MSIRCRFDAFDIESTSIPYRFHYHFSLSGACFLTGLLIAGLNSILLLMLALSILIRWQDSNPSSNPAGKQASCADFSKYFKFSQIISDRMSRVPIGRHDSFIGASVRSAKCESLRIYCDFLFIVMHI